MLKHLATISQPAIEQILKGKKTIETRFSQKKIPPFGVIAAGDIVYFKAPGKDVCGQFKVKKVISIENLEKEDWDMIKKIFGRDISSGSKELDEKFYKDHTNSKFGTLIFIENVEQLITSPINFRKKDQRGWTVLE